MARFSKAEQRALHDIKHIDSVLVIGETVRKQLFASKFNRADVIIEQTAGYNHWERNEQAEKAIKSGAESHRVAIRPGKAVGRNMRTQCAHHHYSCMGCEQAIDKDTVRVAIEREVDTGAMVTRAPGYLHPRCVAGYLDKNGGSKADVIAGLRANSRLAPADLDAALALIA